MNSLRPILDGIKTLVLFNLVTIIFLSLIAFILETIKPFFFIYWDANNWINLGFLNLFIYILVLALFIAFEDTKTK